MQRIRQQREAQTSPTALPALDQEASIKRRERQIVDFLDPAMEPALAINKNPLNWWALNAPKYPLIAHIARNALAVVELLGHSERAVSQSGFEMTQ